MDPDQLASEKPADLDLHYCKGRERNGSVVDSRQRGCGFEPHWHHCVVSLSMTH